jgi:hypothetical protein
MNGFITRRRLAVWLTGGLALVGGCETYRNCVDPCYPSRYEFQARQEVYEAEGPQINNGHVLDQTVWNSHFEPGTDKLTQAGLDHLAYLARRRPCPDSIVYLQTAQDLPYDQANPERLAEARVNLDNHRIQAIQNYLTAQTAGRHLTFEVVVHDPAEVGIAAQPAGISVQKMYLTSQGSLPTQAAAGATGGGGAGAGAPPAAGGGR